MWGAGGPPPPQVKPGGIPGCLKIAIVLGVLVIVLLAVLAFVLSSLVNNIADNLGIDPNGGDGGSVGAECPFLSDADAKAVLGGSADAGELEGLYDLSFGMFIDKRVLTNSPDCYVTEGAKSYLARVALHQGGDAAQVFATERKNAEPTSEDQGGGLSIENSGYFGGAVSGLGDEAFCTGLSDAIMAGVLVRQGDRVVYVSVGGSAEGASVPDMSPTTDGVIASPGLCSLAQEVARAVLK